LPRAAADAAALSPSPMLLFLLVAPAAALSCGECATIQESIQRSILRNISALEKQTAAGVQTTATIEIGQIVWHLCSSDAWGAQRYRPSLDAACAATVAAHVETLTEQWKEKRREEYADLHTALRMKRAVCTHSAISACTFEQLPSDYEPLRPKECAVCHALASDLFGVVSRTRDRPKSAKSDSYFRLLEQMAQACAELPMRHAIRPAERDEVAELCEEIWDEFGSHFTKLALRPSAAYARNLCKGIDLCEEEAPLDGVFDDVDESSDKDEL
jgi:hypothetical protein